MLEKHIKVSGIAVFCNTAFLPSFRTHCLLILLDSSSEIFSKYSLSLEMLHNLKCRVFFLRIFPFLHCRLYSLARCRPILLQINVALSFTTRYALFIQDYPLYSFIILITFRQLSLVLASCRLRTFASPHLRFENNNSNLNRPTDN